MKESERDFLKGIDKQLRNDTVYTIDICNREYTNPKEKEYIEALKGVTNTISKQLNKNVARENDFWDNFNKRLAAQEGRREIERLIEIAENRSYVLQGRLNTAKEIENEELIEKYNQEIAENDKNLEIYRAKYKEYKAALEG